LTGSIEKQIATAVRGIMINNPIQTYFSNVTFQFSDLLILLILSTRKCFTENWNGRTIAAPLSEYSGIGMRITTDE
jgi:hypothetical protein